jgi:uncharacterized protein (DUF169 family)
MPKFKRKVEKIVELLSLKWPLIAVKFLANAEETEENALTRKVSVCEALDMVRRDKSFLRLSKENCDCPGGRHFTGLQFLPQETIAKALTRKGHRVYESASVATASISRQPQPVSRGEAFILGPLERFKTDPDIVFLFVNPAQADRTLGLISFNGAEPFIYYPASSICSTIANVLAKARPELNLISFFERKRGTWSSDEFILALPLKDFEAAVENIPRSGYGLA